jgi:hypothetical protein
LTTERLSLFERYVAGDLSEHELHSFQNLLISDAEFQKEFNDFSLVFKATQLYGELDFRKSMNQWQKEIEGKPNKKLRVLVPVIVKVAASVIVLLGVGIFFYQYFNSKEQSVYAVYFEVYPMIGDTRGNNMQLFQADYADRRYDDAYKRIQLLSESEMPASLRFLYSGV